MRCPAVSPAQRAEMIGDISGSDALPGSERIARENSMAENRWPRPGAKGGALAAGSPAADRVNGLAGNRPTHGRPMADEPVPVRCHASPYLSRRHPRSRASTRHREPACYTARRQRPGTRAAAGRGQDRAESAPGTSQDRHRHIEAPVTGGYPCPPAPNSGQRVKKGLSNRISVLAGVSPGPARA